MCDGWRRGFDMGWEPSPCAGAPVAPVQTVSPVEPARRVLAAAEAAVAGPRQDTYGNPADGFACTAALWTAYLHRRGVAGPALAAADVPAMMALLKISRLAATPGHGDSIVDLAGYGALLACCPPPAPGFD